MKLKACCTWITFHDGFLAIWNRGCSSHTPMPPQVLIDWDLAKKHWQRYAMTGGEAARMQLRALSDDVPYRYNFPRPPDDDGGGGPDVPLPTPPSPFPVLAPMDR